MRWVNQTIAEFGQNIGIQGMALAEGGELQLVTEDGGSIGLIHAGELHPPQVIIYRAISLNYLTAGQLRKAMQLADFRLPRPSQVQTACSDKHLIIAIRFPERSFITSSLEEGIAILESLVQVLKGL